MPSRWRSGRLICRCWYLAASPRGHWHRRGERPGPQESCRTCPPPACVARRSGHARSGARRCARVQSASGSRAPRLRAFKARTGAKSFAPSFGLDADGQPALVSASAATLRAGRTSSPRRRLVQPRFVGSLLLSRACALRWCGGAHSAGYARHPRALEGHSAGARRRPVLRLGRCAGCRGASHRRGVRGSIGRHAGPSWLELQSHDLPAEALDDGGRPGGGSGRRRHPPSRFGRHSLQTCRETPELLAYRAGCGNRLAVAVRVHRRTPAFGRDLEGGERRNRLLDAGRHHGDDLALGTEGPPPIPEAWQPSVAASGLPSSCEVRAQIRMGRELFGAIRIERGIKPGCPL